MVMEQVTLYVEAETAMALTNYLRRHADHFGSRSDAADNLLRHALTNIGEMDARRVGEEAMRAAIAPLLAGYAERIAALLMQSGKDAHRAVQLGEALAAHLLPSEHEAARIAEEARLRATARYTRRDLTIPEIDVSQ